MADDGLLDGAILQILGPHVDEDVCEYVRSLLSEDPKDADAREALAELLRT